MDVIEGEPAGNMDVIGGEPEHCSEEEEGEGEGGEKVDERRKEADKRRILDLIKMNFLPLIYNSDDMKDRIKLALTQLGDLCCDEAPYAEPNRVILARTRGFALIVQAMLEFSDDTELHSAGCRVLRNVCAGDWFEVIVNSITFIGGIEAIMTDAPSVLRTMNQSILAVVAVLARDSEASQKMVELGALECVLQFVLDEGSSLTVQKLGCLFLENLIAAGTSLSTILGAGGLKVPAEILSVHSQDADLCNRARSIAVSLVARIDGPHDTRADQLDNESETESEPETETEINKEEVDKRRIVEIVMEDLRTCVMGTSNDVLESLEELTDLFHAEKPHVLGNLLWFHESGGAVAVLTAMIKYKDNEDVQAYGIRTLMHSISRGLWTSKNGIAESISLLGGFPMIVRAMHEWNRNKLLQECSCSALSQLSLLSMAFREQLLDSGGVKAVIKAMIVFPSNPRIVSRSCIFLKRMVNYDKRRVRDIFFESGGPLIFGKVIACQKDSRAVCREVVHCLRKIIV